MNKPTVATSPTTLCAISNSKSIARVVSPMSNQLLNSLDRKQRLPWGRDPFRWTRWLVGTIRSINVRSCTGWTIWARFNKWLRVLTATQATSLTQSSITTLSKIWLWKKAFKRCKSVLLNWKPDSLSTSPHSLQKLSQRTASASWNWNDFYY